MTIDKTAILEFFTASVPQTIAEKDLFKRLEVDSDHRHEFKRLLHELIAAGEIVELKKNRLALPERLNLVIGHVQANRKGFAFVIPKQPGKPDVFISADNLGNAFHGDFVIARLLRSTSGKTAEGEIAQILQRGQTRVIGAYEHHGQYGFVVPEDVKLPYKVYIDAANRLDAKPRQIVVAQILRHDEHHRNPDGQIVEILGYPQTQGIDEKIIIEAHHLPTEFPANALKEADAFPDAISGEELRTRLDLRAQCLFTIDGENARDFDDAVSIERLENGHYKLGVHIADVNFYVKEGSPLDFEAYQRGTSVYFPDRAIPMFPERLSNNLCSLREGEDRLTMSVFMEFDATAKLAQYDIAPSVMRSSARLTYTAVRQMLQDGDEALRQRYAAQMPSLWLMKELSELLLQRRIARGSLDFDLPEPEVVLDIQGNVESILKAERNLAHRMIEEFMLAANETVAAHLTWMHVPTVYRTHEPPDEDKLGTLNDFLGSLGLNVRGTKNLHPKEIQRLLKLVRGKSTEHLVNKITLRAMKQARYTVQNSGHFGLASTCYTHFTSPIRRYPDLIAHRILKDALAGRGFSEDAVEQRREQLATIAEHSSMRERAAMEAEREILEVKKLRFMEDKLGDVFNGVISGVANFGLFVELRDFFVEGLVHVTNLRDDFYQYREETYSLVGERSKKVYRVGDAVRVQIADVSVARRQMDFLLL